MSHLVTLDIHYKEIVNLNIIEVSVGTNCPQGGDSGHGGRTIISFRDLASTDMRFRTDIKSDYTDIGYIELFFGGDAEKITLIEGLEFILRKLKQNNSE